MGCAIPSLQEGVSFVPSSLSRPDLVVQLFTEAVGDSIEVVCRDLGGEQLASWTESNKGSLVKQSIEMAVVPGCRRLCVVLPDGRLVNPHLSWQQLQSELTMPVGSGTT